MEGIRVLVLAAGLGVGLGLSATAHAQTCPTPGSPLSRLGTVTREACELEWAVGYHTDIPLELPRRGLICRGNGIRLRSQPSLSNGYAKKGLNSQGEDGLPDRVEILRQSEDHAFVFVEDEEGDTGWVARGYVCAAPGSKTDWTAWDRPLTRACRKSEFGYRTDPINGTQRFHSGIDLAAPVGTPIYAPARGKVKLAGMGTHANDLHGYGYIVVLEHDDGTESRYAHMCCGTRKKPGKSSIAVKEGDIVEAGDLLGEIGTTGRSTGPHLHFETLTKGHPVNPLLFLSWIPRCYSDYQLASADSETR